MPIKTCRACLYQDDHPLGLVIDETGLCSGCRVHQEKDSLDWNYRWQRLVELVKPYKSNNSINYDCIVPVTGAGDSFFTLHVVKNKLGLNPLLVSYNRYYNSGTGIKNLAQLRRHFNSDILIQNVNPESVKRIIRTTLRELFSFQWPVIAGHTVFPVQVAVSHKIPLIIWGAHQGVEQVGMFSHTEEVEMTRRYRHEHDLMGLEADDLLSEFDCLNESDIWQYRYPSDDQIHEIGIRGIYLGNYVRWDPYEQHKLMVKTAGFQSSHHQSTFDKFDHVDDLHYLGMHELIKRLKHGYGKVTDQLCREIRHGRITRDEALKMNSDFMHPNGYMISSRDLLLEWLGIDKSSFEGFIRGCYSNYTSASVHCIKDYTEKGFFDLNSSLFRQDKEYPPLKQTIFGKGYP